MIAQTLLVTAILAFLALTRKSGGAAIGPIIAAAMIWPEFLRVPLGLIEASAPRLIALLLLGAALARRRQRAVRGCGVDRIVLILWLWTILASLLADGEFSHHVTGMIGRGLDTILMYFVVRFYVTSTEDLRKLALWLAFVAVVMGVLGIVETTTTRTPYEGMEAFRTWSWIDKEDQFRYGFLRAKGSMDVHIYFGMAMMLLTGMLWSINKGFPAGSIGRWSILLAVLGTLSSMSSGPWLGCALIFLFGLYRFKPSLIRPSLYLVGAMAVFLEAASNRHFYNLIDYLALDPHTAWYRTRLLEVAATHLSDFWLIGTGSNWPHHWGPILDGRNHVDVVNHFLIVGLYGGLPAMFLYISSHYQAVKYVSAMRKSSTDPALGLVGFCLVCVLLSLDFSSLSVGLYGPPQILSYILLALIVSVSQMDNPASKVAQDSTAGIAIQHPIIRPSEIK